MLHFIFRGAKVR